MPGDDLWPASAFWDFSLEVYARPRVADACLTLQDEAGADVNLLLLACWLAHMGRRPDAARATRLRAIAAEHQETIIRPLRAARRALKARPLPADGFLARPLDALRRTVAAAELEAERAEQLALERLARGAPAYGGVAGGALAMINLELLTGLTAGGHPALEAFIAAALGRPGHGGDSAG